MIAAARKIYTALPRNSLWRWTISCRSSRPRHFSPSLNSERGDIELTCNGKAFAEADISTRKGLFREAALAHVTLLQQMNSALASKSDHTMPLELFRDTLDEHFSDDDVQRQIETALNWGRYGDIFTYDSESDRLSSHRPADLAEDSQTVPLP